MGMWDLHGWRQQSMIYISRKWHVRRICQFIHTKFDIQLNCVQ